MKKQKNTLKYKNDFLLNKRKMELVCFSCLKTPSFKEETSHKTFCNNVCQKQYHTVFKIGESIFDQQNNISRDVFISILRRYQNDFLHLTYALNTTNDEEKLRLMLKWIVEYDIGIPNLTDNILKYSCMNGFLRILRIIFEYHPGFVTQARKNLCLQWAAQGNEDPDTFRFLLQNGSNPNANDFMLKSAWQGRVRTIEFLLKEGILDPSKDSQFIVTTTASKSQKEVLRILLNDPRVNPSHNNQQLLRQLMSENNMEMVKFLLDNSLVNPRFLKGSILKYAVRARHYEMIKLLLSKRWYTNDIIKSLMTETSLGNDQQSYDLLKEYLTNPNIPFLPGESKQ